MSKSKTLGQVYTPIIPPEGFGFGIDLNPIDALNATANAIEDVATSVIDAIPGGQAVREAVGDFAKTAAGQVLFRAMATAFTGGLGFLGPQLATVAWAVPGMVAGDQSFTDSWTNEFAWRVKTTGEILGADAGKTLSDQITGALNQVSTQLKNAGIDPNDVVDSLQKANIDPHDVIFNNLGIDPTSGKMITDVTTIAQKYGISPEAAAMVISAWNGTPPPDRGAYDMATGQKALNVGIGTAKKQGINVSKLQTANKIAATTTVGAQTKGGTLATAVAAKNASLTVPHASQTASQTIKEIALPVGGAALGVGAAVVAGLAMPLVVGAGALAGLGGWLLGRPKT